MVRLLLAQAYGQTGSGKTYTMLGAIPDEQGQFPPEAGLIPRIFSHLFGRIRELESQVVPDRPPSRVFWSAALPPECQPAPWPPPH